MEFSKLQRLACLAIPGMMMTPTATTEVLLGLPPLHVINEAEAQAAIYRIMFNHLGKPTSTDYCHTEVNPLPALT
jgi:hypothetical protein